jgi:penicillin G amidase
VIKRLLLLLAILLLVLGAVSAAGYGYLRSSEPRRSGEARLAGLAGAVEVRRDSLGIPYVDAGSEMDLMRAVGYLHASERLWQMELFRRVSQGRLAEVLGAAALDDDRFLRTLGMDRAAAASMAVLDAEHIALLQAYADGINSWMRERTGALPPEFVALRFQPEPWEPRHSVAIARIVAWDLADWNVGLEVQRVLERAGPEMAELIYPGYPAWGPTIVGGEPDPAAAAPPRPRLDRAAAAARIPEVPPLAAHLLHGASMARASNSWVVSGSRTASGRPILANDPHLGLTAPSIWMPMVMRGGDIQVAGVTIPGMPNVIIGRTPAVAWGFTNAMVDDADFVVEQLDETETRYRAPDGWRELEVREETIQVRGREPAVHRVRITRNGPLISDVDRRATRPLALRWTGHYPSTAVRAPRAMNRARSAAELRQALREFDDPHQIGIYADTTGEIGIVMVGRVPLRSAGDGVLPVEGWTGEHEWLGFLELDQHPRLENPEEGFIATANNAILPLGTGPRIANMPAEPYRAARIRELLRDARDLTVADVARQQVDVRDAFAVRYLPHAIRAAEAAGDAQAVALLRGWDARASVDSRAASVFYTWHARLQGEARRALLGDDRLYFPRYALNRLLDREEQLPAPAAAFARERLDSLSAVALRAAVQEAAGRPWGELHQTVARHPLAESRLLDRALGLNHGPFPSHGSPYTVNVALFGSRGPPFVSRDAASMRFVTDLADAEATAHFIIPGGVSGVPFSRHYADQLSAWREGRLAPLRLRGAPPAGEVLRLVR